MSKKQKMFERLAGETPVALDMLWGSLSVCIYVLANFWFGLFNWPGWFLLATGANGILLVIEVRRFRLPLEPKYRAARRIALAMILCFMGACLIAFIKLLLFSK